MDGNIFENGEKYLRFQTETDACEQGLSVLLEDKTNVNIGHYFLQGMFGIPAIQLTRTTDGFSRYLPILNRITAKILSIASILFY